jgi:hypothetical protein
MGNFDRDAAQATCHEEYRTNYPNCFDKGSDIEYGLEFRHMGIHRHIHTADSFLKELGYR